MEKANVIAIRDALIDNGANRASVKVIFDNGIAFQLASDQIFWDDDNECVIGIGTDFEASTINTKLPINIICTTYEHIQFFECNTNVVVNPKMIEIENLSTILNNLAAINSSITEENIKKVVEYYSKLNDPRYELGLNYQPTDIIRGEKPTNNNEE